MEMREKLAKILARYLSSSGDCQGATWRELRKIAEAKKEIEVWVKDQLPVKKKITKERLEEDKQACAYFCDGWNNAIIEVEINIEEE